MNYHVTSYLIYLPITILLTAWVGHKLFKNGKLFLLDIFEQNQALAESINQLLMVGFYLINIGYAVYTLAIAGTITDAREMIEMLSQKVDIIILILGGMHFGNIFIFYRLRRRHFDDKRVKAIYQ